MTFGPKNFETLDTLLGYIKNDLFGSAGPNNQVHPLRRAISEHIDAHVIDETTNTIKFFLANMTRASKDGLKQTFTNSATAMADTPQKYITKCFWDNLQKDSASISNALLEGGETQKEMLQTSEDPRDRSHHKSIAVLKSNAYFYRKHFGNDEAMETYAQFDKALAYIEDTLLPEMKRLFGEALVKEKPEQSLEETFQEEWENVAKQLVIWRDTEHEQGLPRVSRTGKTYPTFPNNMGYTGLMPTQESLGL